MPPQLLVLVAGVSLYKKERRTIMIIEYQQDIEQAVKESPQYSRWFLGVDISDASYERDCS